MGSDAQIVRMEDAPLQIIDGDRGKNYPSRTDQLDEGFCLFLNAGNVTTDGFKFDHTTFITKERDKLLRKGKLKRKDIVITTRGTVGNVAFYDNKVPFDHIRINSGMVIIRTEENLLDPRYTYYFLKSKAFENQVQMLRTGSAQPQLPIRDINRIKMPIPSLVEQKRIAHILGTLDDKIELNQRMNETLEAIARAIFKSWFVDFDPVRAKMAGEPYPLPDAVMALFPDALVESELGMIPKGWEVKSLLEISNVFTGGTPKTSRKEYWNGHISWLTAKDISKSRNLFVFETEKAISDLGIMNSNAKILPRNSVVISARGSVGKIALLGRAMAINQTNYALKTKDEHSDYYFFILMDELINTFQQKSYGTIFDTITIRTLEDTKVVKPNRKLIRTFELHIQPLIEKISANILVTRNLKNILNHLTNELFRDLNFHEQ